VNLAVEGAARPGPKPEEKFVKHIPLPWLQRAMEAKLSGQGYQMALLVCFLRGSTTVTRDCR
jgi:hypothetical protein